MTSPSRPHWWTFVFGILSFSAFIVGIVLLAHRETPPPQNSITAEVAQPLPPPPSPKPSPNPSPRTPSSHGPAPKGDTNSGGGIHTIAKGVKIEQKADGDCIQQVGVGSNNSNYCVPTLPSVSKDQIANIGRKLKEIPEMQGQRVVIQYRKSTPGAKELAEEMSEAFNAGGLSAITSAFSGSIFSNYGEELSAGISFGHLSQATGSVADDIGKVLLDNHVVKSPIKDAGRNLSISVPVEMWINTP
jgi:hypothetical protein